MRKKPFLLVGMLAALLTACTHEKTMFHQVPAAESGILFSNRITESDSFNIMAFEYVYNGGGVGVGDFNNDGRQDLFFAGNMVDNKLYLNKSDFKFEDITAQAGVAGEDRWCSGVALVDINSDGWLDIYACATTYKPGSRRANLLYVNQGAADNGAPVFKEMAQAYGIADTSHTTNAAFFDYDNDGDLDLYLVTNEMDKKKSFPNQYRQKIKDGSSNRTDKLYRNEGAATTGHPIYTDVSKEAGILIEGFGLGVSICDINRDGWKDVYVTNDYLTNDLLWMNNGDGTFTDKAAAYFKHTCYSAMGNDVADINNDALLDLVAVDMLPEDNFRRKTMLPPNNYSHSLNNDYYGYQYQYVRNTLQLNQGNQPGSNEPIFSEISMLAGVSSTDWSWSPLFADYDNDGDRDLTVTNGFPRDVTNRDFVDYHAVASNLVDRASLLEQIPIVKIHNYAFRNEGGTVPTFTDASKDWGFMQPSFSNGSAYADLDNDGDLDYIVNNINDSAFVFQNQLLEQKKEGSNWLKIKFDGSTNNPNGLGATVELFYENGKRQFIENSPYRGYLSSVEGGAHFGLGSAKNLDSLRITWPEGRREVLKNTAVNQVLTVKFENASPFALPQTSPSPTLFADVTAQFGINFMHRDSDFIDFNVQRLLLHKFSQFGPGIAVGDVNGDGLDDCYVGGSHFFKGTFFVQNKVGQPGFSQQDLFEKNTKTKLEEELGMLLLDVDGDNDNDLYLVSGGNEFSTDSAHIYQDRLFLNDGGQFRLAPDGALPKFNKSGSCARAADFDQDGDLDIFVGGRVVPSQYPLPASSYLLINESKGGVAKFSLANERVAPALKNLGLVCDAIWTDADNDGWVDLLLVGEWMAPTFLKNNKGKLDQTVVVTHGNGPATGWWNSIAATDFDLDGDMDYVVGNLGKNTLFRADDSRHIAVYTADFDGNGDPDPVPATFFAGLKDKPEEFPYFNRLDMEKQMPKLKGLFPRHADLGKAPMQAFLAKFPKAKPSVLKATCLATSYLENLGGGKFKLHELPLEAQLAPVNGIIAEDFDGDGNPDLLLTGNDFGAEVGMGRYDAMNGQLLLGDGKGRFSPILPQASGIYTPGDAKGLAAAVGSDGSLLVVSGQNKNKVQVFRSSAMRKPIALQPNDFTVLVKWGDGHTQRREIGYGQGFLSQSTRKLLLPPGVVSVEVIDFKGNKRQLQGDAL